MCAVLQLVVWCEVCFTAVENVCSSTESASLSHLRSYKFIPSRPGAFLFVIIFYGFLSTGELN